VAVAVGEGSVVGIGVAVDLRGGAGEAVGVLVEVAVAGAVLVAVGTMGVDISVD